MSININGKKLERIILHIDVNSAFLSWEAAYRLKNGEKEDLREIPSVVGGDQEQRRGIVLAKSVPAKKYGIVTGETIFAAKRKCPNLKVAPSNFGVYKEGSRQFFEVLSDYTDRIQKFSIDEAFLDMTGILKAENDPIGIAYEIKDRIREELGFTVSIGVATNKLLAKMASEMRKPDKVTTLFPWEIKEKMWPLPIEELFMVGSASARKLKEMDIRTIGELADYDKELIRGVLKKHGEMVWNYANVIDKSEVKNDSGELKCISHEITTSQNVTEREKAYKILIALSEKVAVRLRKQEKLAYGISVNMKTNNFLSSSHQKKVMEPLRATGDIIDKAKEVFDELWQGEALRLIGVRVFDLRTDKIVQLSIYDMCDKKVDNKLDDVMDELRETYGSSKVVRASLLNSKDD